MPAAPAAVRRVILGTAGHIDHGKTSLVERLTGTRTDRLPEEQERGMTIDVGYAEFTLPDGTEVGLLDVPGHERLVRTMVAGATAMDLALLVVAADDGPMPQTREHVDVLDVLGVRALVVALTKVDLADAETIERREREIREILAPTAMRDAPILRVSNQTGEGLDALRAALAARLPPPREDRPDLWAFRMPVLRAFVAPGRGTVVTGIPLSGRAAEGDAIELLPGEGRGKIRGIQVHHRPAKEARAHHRAALALADVDVAAVRRGMSVVAAGSVRPTKRMAVRLRLLASRDAPLEHRHRVRVHVGADQATGRVHLLEGSRVLPGEETVVEIETGEPVVVAPGDRFVLREENASATLGGGVVVEALTARLPRRGGIVKSLLERSERLDDPSALVLGALVASGEAGVRLPDVAAVTGIRPDALPAVLDALVARGDAVKVGRTGQHVVVAPAFRKTCERVEAAVQALHAKDRAMGSLPLAAVRAAAGRGDPAVLDAAVEALVQAGALVRADGGNVRHRTHAGAMSGPEQQRADRILGLLRQGAGQPPAPEDLEADLRVPSSEAIRLLRVLESRGLVFRAGDAWFDAGWLAEGKRRLAEFARAHGGFTPADARTILNSTRKWVIPLLEALDKAGFSKRVGEKRIVR
jgi:selenocysteine-specific elongation factor